MKEMFFSMAFIITHLTAYNQPTLLQNTFTNQQQNNLPNSQTQSQFISTSYLLDAAMKFI
jgi:hypothetical protein